MNICDNLDVHLQEGFLNALKSVNYFRWFEEWLENDENLEIWENGKLTASEKGILITKFVGAAWEKCS